MTKALIIIALLSTFPTYALSVDFSLKLSQSGEFAQWTEEDLKSAGCDLIQDGYDGLTCVITKVVDERDLPVDVVVGDSSLSISRDGLVSLGISVGDSDFSSSGSLNLPTDENGNLLALPAPLKLEVSGGDHASGYWLFSGSLSIMVD